MRMKKIIQNNIRLILMLFVIIVVSTSIGHYLINALTNEEELIHPKDKDIEMSSLIIGTHIIYLSSLTDEIYNIAVESQSQTNQNNIYYKSELSNGSWYEIGSALGISSITDLSQAVDVSVIEQLNVRYHTKSDGITYDLLNNSAISIFDINNPYDLSSNDDIDAVMMQLNTLQDKENKNESDEYYEKLLSDFVNQDLADSDTVKLDTALQKLQKQYQKVDKDSKAFETIMAVMDKIDSSRRAVVYQKLADKLETLIDDASLTNTENSELSVNSEVFDAIGSSYKSVTEALTEYGMKANMEGSSNLSKMQKEVIDNIIEGKGNLNDLINQAAAISSLNNGVIDNPEEEKKMLDKLISSTEKDVSSYLSSGTDDKYKSAVSNGASKTALSELLKKQQNTLNEKLSELKFFYKAHVKRGSLDEAKELIEEKFDTIDTFKSNIADDELASYFEDSIDSFMEDLKLLYENVAGSSTGRLQALLTKKEQFEVYKQNALDNNNLSDAKTYEQLLKDLQELIDDVEKELNRIITSDTATPIEKAAAEAQLGSQSAIKNILSQKEQALNAIAENDFEALKEALYGMEALVNIAPDNVLEAVNEIYKKLTAKEMLEDVLDDKSMNDIHEAENLIEDIIADNVFAFYGNNLNTNTVENMILNYFSEANGYFGDNYDSFVDLSAKQQVAALCAVEMSAEMVNSSQLHEMAANYSSLMDNIDNPFLYDYFNDESEVYIPLDAIAKCYRFRYIFVDSKKEVTLQNSSEYYKFAAFSTCVLKNNEIAFEMNFPTILKETLYIHEDYADTLFGCYSINIIGTEYGVIYDADINKDIEKLIDVFSSAEFE